MDNVYIIEFFHNTMSKSDLGVNEYIEKKWKVYGSYAGSLKK